MISPDIDDKLSTDALKEHMRLKGYNVELLNYEPEYGNNMLESIKRYYSVKSAGLTIKLVKQKKNQTKVKVRFTNLYYPASVSECYKKIWPAIDKQIFLDKNLD